MARRDSNSGFRPGLLLRNRHLQSTLASRGIRSWLLRDFTRFLETTSEEHILDCGEGVRLQGFRSRPGASPSRGLVVVFHGWEGSGFSTYVVGLTRHLLERGFHVFRLNFRDHGDTHHLNEDLFHSCRIDEVVGAVRAIVDTFPERPLFLVGYSLGGNFAIRVALRNRAIPVPIRRIVAICPVLDPSHCLRAIEAAPRYYERHFLRKWKRSLQAKQAAFPDRYSLGSWPGMDSLREMTRHLVEKYTPFPGLEAYLDGYSIARERTAALETPTHLIASADDPVIPHQDLMEMARPAALEIELQPTGGHCGFVDRLGGPAWVERRVATLLEAPETP